MAKLFYGLSALALIVFLVSFAAASALFYRAPDQADAVNTVRVEVYMSTSNKTVTGYMSPRRERIYEALNTTYVLSFFGVLAFLFAGTWFARGRKRAAGE